MLLGMFCLIRAAEAEADDCSDAGTPSQSDDQQSDGGTSAHVGCYMVTRWHGLFLADCDLVFTDFSGVQACVWSFCMARSLALVDASHERESCCACVV